MGSTEAFRWDPRKTADFQLKRGEGLTQLLIVVEFFIFIIYLCVSVCTCKCACASICVYVCARPCTCMRVWQTPGWGVIPFPCQVNLSYLSTLPQNLVKCWNHALDIRWMWTARGVSRGLFQAYFVSLEGTQLFLKELLIETCPNNCIYLYSLVDWILNYSMAEHDTEKGKCVWVETRESD